MMKSSTVSGLIKLRCIRFFTHLQHHGNNENMTWQLDRVI